MMCPFVCAIVAILVIYTILKFLEKDPTPYYGIYHRPGKWYQLKRWTIYLVLHLRKCCRNDALCDQTELLKREQMEKLQPLENNPKAVDAIHIAGANSDGCYVSLGFVRKPGTSASRLLILQIPNVGLLQLMGMPDTSLKADSNSYKGDGLCVELVRPMREWKITYEGKMKFTNDPNRTADVVLRMTWQSHLDYFNFSQDALSMALSRAIAKEIWSTEYFEDLKKFHQNHYEQMGNLDGDVDIEGVGHFQLRLNSLRTHTYSDEFDWKTFHRCILHNITVEDGTRFMVGIVSAPLTFSVFECGYMYTPSGKLIGVDWCDLPLWYMGEYGEAPTNYGFTFKAGSESYQVQVEVLNSAEIFFGTNWETRVLERTCQFTVDGKKGWGFSQWQYRHHGGNPDFKKA